MPADPVDPSHDVLAVYLREYDAMRAEINNRSNAQHTLINLNVTALGVVAGLVLTGRGDVQLLLLIPLISTSMGLLYFDHSGAIIRVGVYLDSVVFPAISAIVNDGTKLSWEDFASRMFRTNVVSVLAFAVPLFVLFLGGPIFATIVVFPSLGSAWAWALWSLDVVLQIALCGVWFSLVTGRSMRINRRQAEVYLAWQSEDPARS